MMRVKARGAKYQRQRPYTTRERVAVVARHSTILTVGQDEPGPDLRRSPAVEASEGPSKVGDVAEVRLLFRERLAIFLAVFARRLHAVCIDSDIVVGLDASAVAVGEVPLPGVYADDVAGAKENLV